jgi:hypothetical protein
MGRTITTQATGKSWKLTQALGCLSVILGITLVILTVSLAEPGRRSPASQSAIPFLLIMLGLPAYVFGRLGAWWFHA